MNPSFHSYVLDQIGRVVPGVRDRGMFGGVGIYADDLFFALIDDDALYFKVDDSNRADFEQRAMGPFRPFGEGGEVMQYYQVPDDVLEDAEALRPWVEKAIQVARTKKTKGRRPRQR
ncbi:MAG TPA: TfoX/Sxy family protein [Gemmatimonadales bacterium]